MTGGFNTTMRGIRIDIPATLNKYYNKNEKEYNREEFEKFLKDIKLAQNNNGFRATIPTNKSCVASIEYDDGEEDSSEGYLINGAWDYQYWARPKWTPQQLKDQREFSKEEYYNEEVENKLRKKWENLLVLDGKMTIVTITSEWVHYYFPTRKSQKGGYDKMLDKDYKYLYQKYKTKYLDKKDML